ncbi:bifunctional helix-turn-helix transcriptional regulator/GNAT family N-acetyltransferase [Nocardioides sp. MAHUQ-72]|uniref:bifunctional helix-turn-helix transcriptional regulator/GNAT family N-acetyltransferase n=1 Tax=unclassified Nocardioides TaxID=2615069 RepID=UPI00360F8422
MAASPYAVLRRFNRAWTQRVGVLDESFLGSGRPLGLARLLFEIGPDGAGVLTLRQRLGLDSGYLSRLLRQLADDGLVEVVPDPGDGRRRLATLTGRGLEEWQSLEDRSERLARDLVAPLSQSQRARLDEALATAELLVRAATLDLEPVAASAPEAVAAVRSYFDELDERFPGGFDPGDAWTHDAAAFSPPEGIFVVARDEDRVVGCGAVQRLAPGTAEIKRMWVHPSLRGAGLGSRLLRHLEGEAAALGYATVRLDTNDSLAEAIAMYERAGYRRIERYNDNPHAEAFFEKPLV